MKKTTGKVVAAENELRAHAMAKPEATEHFPWGDRAIKVKGKVFLFMGADDKSWGLSCKLPQSANMALMLPFAEPTGYGLGKAGWVSARFSPNDSPPVDLLKEWIDESYRAVAPAKLLKEGAGSTPAPAKQPAAKKRPAAKKKPGTKAKPAATKSAKPAATKSAKR